MLEEGLDVVLLDTDLVTFADVTADDYAVWEMTADVLGLSDEKFAGDGLGYCGQGKCMSTGTVFLRATPGTVATVKAMVHRLEDTECREWEQYGFNMMLYANSLEEPAAFDLLPRRHFANFTETILQVDAGGPWHAPFDYHLLHTGYIHGHDKLATMW